MREDGPPLIAMRVIARLATRADADHVLGDLEEGYADRVASGGVRRARQWYWRQALALVAGFGWLRFRSAVSPSRLTRELRFALVSFRRTPGVAVAAMVTLGIGIAAPTTMFGIVDGMYAKLPVEDAASVVDVRLVDRTRGTTVAIPASLVRTWRETATSVTPLGGYRGGRVAVSGDSMSPARVASAEVTPEVLAVLGVRPVIGRLFGRDDVSGVAAPGVLIREDRWEQWYDRSADALGARVRVSGRDHVIVGVLPHDFGFPSSHEVWTPLDATAEPDRTLRVIGRLAAGVSAQAAGSELASILRRLGATGAIADVKDVRVIVDEYVMAMHGRDGRTTLGYVNLIVSLLVVIAAANVSALFLARGVTRSSEFAVRMAMGAGRARIVRQLVLEALLLAAGGALVGLVLAQTATHWFVETVEARGALPFWADFGLKPSMLVWVSALMFLATVVAGLLPSLRASRIDLVAVMKGSGPQGRDTIRTLPFLVGAEVMLSCMLLILSGLVVKAAFASVQRVGAFPLENVVTGQFVLENYDYPAASDRARFYEALRTALDGRAEVESYALATAMPGDGTTAHAVTLDGQPIDREADRPLVQVRHVEPSFFAMFGMHTLAGRTFGRTDDHNAGRVAVVNEAWVRGQPSIGDVLGLRLTIDLPSDGPTDYRLVGVVSDPGVSVDDGRRVPAVFVPLAQALPASAILALRTYGGMDVSRDIMTGEVRRIDADLPLSPIVTLESIVRRENDGGRLFGSLFAALGLSALLLAMVGLYGVVAFTTQRRTRDIGIMRALGAFEHALVRSTTLRALRPVVPAIAFGLAAAWVIGPQIGGISLESGTRDPFVFTIVPAVLLICALVAAFVPASRAAKIDPLRALRVE